MSRRLAKALGTALAAAMMALAGPVLAAESFDFDRQGGEKSTAWSVIRRLAALSEVSFRMPAKAAVTAVVRKSEAVVLLKDNEPVPEFDIEMATVIEVDPRLAEIRTVSAKTAVDAGRTTLPKVMASMPAALAGMNAGFFSLQDGTPIGFFMEGGKVIRHSGHDSMNRIFTVDSQGRPAVVKGVSVEPEGVVSAVAGKSSWAESSNSARAAVCVTTGGKVRLVAAYPVSNLGRMTVYLKLREGCESIVHLDGGGSTQMAFKADRLVTGWERKPECQKPSKQSPPQCFRRVPTFLVVLPKTR
ncbi:MAG: phosphodiester glycosidase family protein [Elusimicrobiota bacterium]|jgi:uncharacterized protein YigE (DUF2233 family)